MAFSGYLGGLLYPNTRYPPIIRNFPRRYGQEVWSVSMQNFPLSTPVQTQMTPEEQEIKDLKNRLALMEGKLETQERMFRFTSRVTKKLTCIGQLSDEERQEALALGLHVEDHRPWVSHSWTLNASTSTDQKTLRFTGGENEVSQETFSAQFPSVETITESTTTTVLHRRAGDGSLPSETSTAIVSGISKMYLGNPIGEVIDHGTVPEIEDILVYISADENGEDEVSLEEYNEHLNRLDARNQLTNEKIKLSMQEALEIEEMAASIVKRFLDYRNNNASVVPQNVAANESSPPSPYVSGESLFDPDGTPLPEDKLPWNLVCCDSDLIETFSCDSNELE